MAVTKEVQEMTSEAINGTHRERFPTYFRSEISHNRQYPSLPQQLVGVSLPPQVNGPHKGVITLGIPHILESAASTRPLPTKSLVRVRWWGEQKPGSLFRPVLLANGELTPARRREAEGLEDGVDVDVNYEMQYPVCVSPKRLVEYFQDMKELELDVIDRKSRQKYGRCRLPFIFTESTYPETILRGLEKSNTLCEITAIDHGDDRKTGEVIGYLAVNFDIFWRNEDVSSENIDKEEAIPTPSGKHDEQATPRIALDTDVHDTSDLVVNSSVSSFSYLKSDIQDDSVDYQNIYLNDKSMARSMHEVSDISPSPSHTQIQMLLEKGKALQRSMEKAVIEAPSAINVTDDTFGVWSAPDRKASFPSGMDDAGFTTMFAPCELLTVGADGKPESPNWTESMRMKASSFDNLWSAKDKDISNPDSTTGVDALEMAFESLTFKSEFIAQLQQLRDSSVSSRSSPIQLSVAHSDVTSVIAPSDSSHDDEQVPAFTVTTSLRKRQWRPDYSHVVPLKSTFEHTPLSRDALVERAAQAKVSFFVRCESAYDLQRTPKRRGQRSPSRRKRYKLVSGQLDGHAIFSHLGSTDAWVSKISLYEELDDVNRTSTKGNKWEKKRKRNAIGELQVKFRFCSQIFISPSDASSEILSEESQNSTHRLNRKKVQVRDEMVSFSDSYDGDSVHSVRERQVNQKKLPLRQVLPSTTSRVNLFDHLQLALMIDQATGIKLDQTDTLEEPSSPFIRIQYAVPTRFSKNISRRSHPEHFHRTVKRRLCPSKWFNSLSTKMATFNHINVFPLKVDADSINYFEQGYLILEVWIQRLFDEVGVLLGISKIGLGTFSGFFRQSDIDLFCEQILPFTGADGLIPIEDPFSGHLQGYLRARIAIGTAEQIVVWRSTVRAVIQLQRVVRGFLYRKKNGHYQDRTMNHAVTEDNRLQITVPNENEQSSHQNTKVSQTISNEDPLILQFYKSSFDKVTYPAESIIHELRFDIRKCWASTDGASTGSNGVSDERPKRAGSLVLGCELQGRLVLHNDHTGYSCELKGVPFALWWDASDSNLNSYFVHSFRSSQYVAVEPKSQVVFALRAENGLSLSSAGDSAIGKAQLDLYPLFMKTQDSIDSTRPCKPFSLDVDVPVHWEAWKDDDILLATVLPLRVSYRPSTRASSTPIPLIEVKPQVSEQLLQESDYHFMTLPRTISTTKKLSPADIVLSVHILSLSDLKRALQELVAQCCDDPSNADMKRHLESILQQKYARIILEVKSCLGSEVHESERKASMRHNSTLSTEKNIWYKTWRVPIESIAISNDVHLLSSAVSALQTRLVVHPDLLDSLQKECMQINVLIWCEEHHVSYTIGEVSVPIGAVLFRLKGVEGLFPIQIGEVSTGRVGVHCYIDHSHVEGYQSKSPDKTGFTQENIRHVSVPVSPEIKYQSRNKDILYDAHVLDTDHAIEVSIEEGRNLIIPGSDRQDLSMPSTFITAAVIETNNDGRHIQNEQIRTQIVSSSHPRWYYTNLIVLKNPRWKTLHLEVSVWLVEFNQDDVMPLDHEQKASLLGKAIIDISLLESGWREIHGWYHILDTSQLNVGQIKVRVTRKLGNIPDIPVSLPVGSFGERIFSDNQFSALTTPRQTEFLGTNNELTFDTSGQLQTYQDESTLSFDGRVQSTHRPSNEVQQRSQHYVTLDSTADHMVQSAVGEGTDTEVCGEEPSALTISMLTSSQEEATNTKYVEQHNDFVAANTPTSIQDEMVAVVHSPTSAISSHEEDQGGEVTESTNSEMEIEVEYNKPITLASFGIDEMELSPFSEEMSPCSNKDTNHDEISPSQAEIGIQQLEIDHVEEESAPMYLMVDDNQNQAISNEDLTLPYGATVDSPAAAFDQYSQKEESVSDSSQCSSVLVDTSTLDIKSEYENDNYHVEDHDAHVDDPKKEVESTTLSEDEAIETEALPVACVDEPCSNTVTMEVKQPHHDNNDIIEIEKVKASPHNIHNIHPSEISAASNDEEHLEQSITALPIFNDDQEQNSTYLDEVTHEDKAIQVNVDDLMKDGGQAVVMAEVSNDDENSPLSMDTIDASDVAANPPDSISEDPLSSHSSLTGENRRTVDVGCDAMPTAPHNSDLTSHSTEVIIVVNPAPAATHTRNQSTLTVPDDDEDVRAVNPTEHRLNAPTDDKSKPISPASRAMNSTVHPTLKSSNRTIPVDKLELVYQLLREIRESCGGDFDVLSRRKLDKADEDICFSTNLHSHMPTDTVGSNSSMAHQASEGNDVVDVTPAEDGDAEGWKSGSASLLDNSSARFTSFTEIPAEMKNLSSFRDSSSKTPPSSPLRNSRGKFQSSVKDKKACLWPDSLSLQQEIERRLSLSSSSLPSLLGSFVDGERTHVNYATENQRSIPFGHGSSSSSIAKTTVTQAKSINRNCPGTVKRMFCHDSETERIARIMQGSVQYWLKDEDDSDEENDDCDDDDDDLYF